MTNKLMDIIQKIVMKQFRASFENNKDTGELGFDEFIQKREIAKDRFLSLQVEGDREQWSDFFDEVVDDIISKYKTYMGNF